MHICALIAFSLSLSLECSSGRDAGIPAEFHGVWKISAASLEGKNWPMPEDPDSGPGNGECDMLEIIICKTRAVIVQSDGDAIVCRARVVSSNPELRLELAGLGNRDRRDDLGYALLKPIDVSTLQFAFCGPDAQRINASADEKQIVLTATKVHELP